MVALVRVRDGALFLSGHVAGAAVLGGRRGLADVEDLDAAVGPLPDLDGHVLRHEGAADAHPVPLPVDQVALQFWKQRHRTSISSKLLLNFPDQEEEAWFCPPLVGFSFPADLACGGAPS